MTGPQDPGSDGDVGDDWGFPEVDPAGPASTQLPPPEPLPEAPYDTGSDAWWRAKRAAEAEATEPDTHADTDTDAHVDAPTAAESPPSPLDRAWVPPLASEPSEPSEPPEPPRPAFARRPRAAGDPVPAEPTAAEPTAAEPTAGEPTVGEPTAAEPTAAELSGTEPTPNLVPAVDPMDATDPLGFPPLEDDPVWTGPPETATDAAVVDAAGSPAAAAVASADSTEAAAVASGSSPQPSFVDVPRVRTPARAARVSPLRAVAGAALAVVGVGLAILALLLLGHDEPKGTPTVALPSSQPTATTTPTADPTTTPTPTATTAGPTAPTATTPASTTAPPPVAQAPIVPVTVLNNSRVHGLADRSAARFRAGGWPVRGTGNYRGTLRQTTVYFPPGGQASAERFAAQFGIARVLPRFTTLPGSGVTVVVTRDYA